jgi:amidohydrolase
MMELVELQESLVQQLYQIRRHLHQYPELSFQEFATCDFLCSRLNEWGIPYKRVGDTGLVVDIVGENGKGLHIGLRADMDALPIQEKTGLSFSSLNHGVMHACGHDGHMTILLGTVYQLYQRKNMFRGRVRCIFQPGEEADGAAEKMIEQGVLSNPSIDEMLALHLWPHLPFGTVGVRYGAMTASCDTFAIEIEGKGGHSARPHQAIDAIAVSGHVLQGISYLVMKEANPVDPVVVHIGKIQGGSATNIVADRVLLEGTTRAVSKETRERVKERLVELVEQMVTSFGAKAKVTYSEGHPPVINDREVTKAFVESVEELLGSEAVHLLTEPSMGADDFGAFAERVPSTYFRLGICREGVPCHDLHHPAFQFDDQIIPLGVKILTHSVFKRLTKGV